MNGKTVTLNTNGGWCWYQDPRVIVDSQTGEVVFASIATQAGTAGETRGGDVDVTTVDPATGQAKTTTLRKFTTQGGKGDDHDVAALWERPDGRYLAVYTAHNQGRREKRPQSFYRISTRPHDATDWQDEHVFDWPTADPVGVGFVAVTYSNLHFLAAERNGEGRLYNIARAAGQTWQIATSDDWGETWTYRGIVTLPPEGGRAYSNGYPKFCSNGLDRIDFLITEAHPRDYNNGIYHGYIRDGKTHDTAGKVIDPNTFSGSAPMPEQFTTVFEPAPAAEGAYHTGWTVDLIRDAHGELHALFTCRVGVEPSRDEKDKTTNPLGEQEHRLFYARLGGQAWHTTELGRMGHGLYYWEEDYTGLGAIDPLDGRTLCMSTPFDPRSGAMLNHRELFIGTATDTSKSWTWTPLTEDSSTDNLRPRMVRLKDGRAMVLWLRGEYVSMAEYNLQVVGRVLG